MKIYLAFIKLGLVLGMVWGYYTEDMYVMVLTGFLLLGISNN